MLLLLNIYIQYKFLYEISQIKMSTLWYYFIIIVLFYFSYNIITLLYTILLLFYFHNSGIWRETPDVK